MSTNPQELAISELKVNTVPHPSDVFDEISALAAIWWTREVLESCMIYITGKASEEIDTEMLESETLPKVLQAVMVSFGAFNLACVEFGLLDPAILEQ